MGFLLLVGPDIPHPLDHRSGTFTVRFIHLASQCDKVVIHGLKIYFSMNPVCLHTLLPEYIIDIMDHIAVSAKIIITIMSQGISIDIILNYWLKNPQ